MYIPPAFREERGAQILRFIRQNPFGMLVTVEAGEPCINHIPFLLDEDAGLIYWHLAAANPQASQLWEGRAATLVFHGPHAYVSPTWYEKPGVPTWNFLAVHVSGNPRALDERELTNLMLRLSQVYEGEGGLGTFAGTTSYAGMLAAIRGIAMPLSHVQAKFKLSQNRSPGEQRQVAARLLESGRDYERETGEIMLELLEKP